MAPVDARGKQSGSSGRAGKDLEPSSLSNYSKVSYAKPKKTVKLLEETPCFLPPCPSWVKSPALWSPRLSPRNVDMTTLGWGRHGSQVLLVRQRSSHGSTAVMKQFSRDKLLASPRVHEKVLNEWRIHSALVPHPNIVPLYGAVEDKSYVTLVMEAQSGDLLWYLDETDRETLTEDEARAVAADVLLALAHMHEMGFIHRDVKAENVFAVTPFRATAAFPAKSAESGVGRGVSGAVYGSYCWRLGDFGSAVEMEAVMRPGAPGLHLEGSPPFLSPEYAELWVAPPTTCTAQQLQRATSPKQDIWAIGALVYDMLVGHPPFSGPDAGGSGEEATLTQLAAAIVTQPPSPLPAEAGLSVAGADFIAAALRKAPEERPTAAELLAHPWLTENPMAAAPSRPGVAADMFSRQAADARSDSIGTRLPVRLRSGSQLSSLPSSSGDVNMAAIASQPLAAAVASMAEMENPNAGAAVESSSTSSSPLSSSPSSPSPSSSSQQSTSSSDADASAMAIARRDGDVIVTEEAAAAAPMGASKGGATMEEAEAVARPAPNPAAGADAAVRAVRSRARRRDAESKPSCVSATITAASTATAAAAAAVAVRPRTTKRSKRADETSPWLESNVVASATASGAVPASAVAVSVAAATADASVAAEEVAAVVAVATNEEHGTVDRHEEPPEGRKGTSKETSAKVITVRKRGRRTAIGVANGSNECQTQTEASGAEHSSGNEIVKAATRRVRKPQN
ncbi:hypothetical protein VaNZ11_010706 [Volvox africanus]|uniref:Protein kinase domain-containing protein n=1 Tax=Volvox africanus TaxID=51714 RepID=A0ABQ5SBG6_9CHLO|nr:hypothetical protein VaNZ11_010706 [Volvox africanus]